MSGKQRVAAGNANRLIHEKSPYLIQHAYNPVDWYPWCDEAFEKARREDRPVFLSIGYSTCHWCHVMAHESFEDNGVARLLNDAFVCIKVDREERPDIDKIYMSACQMMTRSGGWPLTVVMTPEGQPFFAATYIPRESRPGRMGMLELIPRIKEMWIKRSDEVKRSAGEIVALLRRTGEEKQAGEIAKDILDDAYEELRGLFDEEYGGFGPPPRFPMPHQLLFLLRYWKWNGEEKALEMVIRTLKAMRCGGIYDHLGYGFHRYSTDEKWLLPHFEKMLYDQALLAMAYTEAYQATKEEFFRTTACEIFTYVLRDMKSTSGGFFSAEDADSEGEEGKYYLWSLDEIREVLGEKEVTLAAAVFRVEEGGNFVDPMTGENTNRNILHMGEPPAELGPRLGISEGSLRQRLAAVRLRLFSARESRVRPAKDNKILADWNGLMIAALAKASWAFGDGAYLKAARNAANFILRSMRTPEGKLLHRHREGSSGITAHLDDYAFMIWGLIECYEASFDVTFLREALKLQEMMTQHFWDREGGGYFFTPDDGEALIIRQKESYDGAVPSGNSVAILNLARLARLTGDSSLETRALSIIHTFSGALERMPAGHAHFMSGLGFMTNPSHEIVIAGKSGAEDTGEMLRTLGKYYLPNTVFLLRPAQENLSDIEEVAPFVKDLKPLQGKATAYVCTDFTCQKPTTDVNEMIKILRVS
jgi:uncharacterized protein YyaL (SSP411 family)